MLRLSRALPSGALLALGLSACFFPDYTFKNQGGGGSTSSATTSSSSTGMGGMGGSGPKEDCFDGVDDDDNGLADCADPACAPVTECVGTIPVGWGTFGYVLLAETDPSSTPTCPSYAATGKYSGNSNLLGGSWSCSQCKCDPPTGESCDLTQDLNNTTSGVQAFQIKDGPGCVAVASVKEVSIPGPMPPWDLTCTAVDTLAAGPLNKSIFAGLPTVSGGMCSPTGGTPALATPTWGIEATACGNVAAMAGCTGQNRCMPKPSAPYQGHVCVGKAGDQSCPSPFTKKHLYYGAMTDTRGCETCGCGDPTGSACQITLDVYSTDACSGTPIATFAAGSCADLTGNPRIGGRKGTITMQPNGGSCTPTKLNPLPVGGIAESAPTTFCCLP